MFRVSLNALDEIANKLHKDSKQIGLCAEELRDVISSLSEFSYMDESRQSLLRTTVRIEEEASQTALLGQTLNRIQERYWQTERRAEDHCEEASRRMPRESVSEQDVTWLAEFVDTIW